VPSYKPDISNQIETSSDFVDVNAFPELPGIDKIIAHQLFRGKIKFFRKILLKFLANHQQFVSQFNSDRAKGDAKATIRLAHTLKGVAGNIGATKLQSVAGNLEQACASDDINIEILLSKVSTELDRLITGINNSEEIKKIIVNPDSMEYIQSDIHGLLVELRGYVENNNTRANELTEKLENLLINQKEHSDLFKKVSLAVSCYDFNEALVQLDQFMDNFDNLKK